MGSFQLVFKKGHALIETLNGLYLLDTGSTHSFSKDGKIKLGEQEFDVPCELMGVGVRYLSEKVGAEVCGLLGMDIINKTQATISYRSKMLSFSDEEVLGTKAESFSYQGLRGIIVTLGKQDFKLLLDTGAPVSYAPSWLLDEYEIVDRVEDFSPLTCNDIYETNLYDIPTEVNHKSWMGRYGELPSNLAVLVAMTGADGILGKMLFDIFDVSFLKSGELYLQA